MTIAITHANQLATPSKYRYSEIEPGYYELPGIVYPDGTTAEVQWTLTSRAWKVIDHALGGYLPGKYSTRLAAADAARRHANYLHRRAQELKLDAWRIKLQAIMSAESMTKYRHARAAHDQAVRTNADDLSEKRDRATYWQEIHERDAGLYNEIISTIGVQAIRIHKLAEARYVQQYCPADYQQVEDQAAPWRQLLNDDDVLNYHDDPANCCATCGRTETGHGPDGEHCRRHG